MQQGYVYYLTEATGKNFHPDFKPELTPKEMLELGVFGGKYLTDCREESISRRSKSIARLVRSIAGAGKDRRCSTGLTTREKSDG